MEPKINPKKLQEEKERPQKKIINRFEAARGRRSEKEDNEDNNTKPKRVPEPFVKFLGATWSSQGAPKTTQSAPKKRPRAPKMSPREPPNALRTKAGSKTLIFQNSSIVLVKPHVFEVGRVIL